MRSNIENLNQKLATAQTEQTKAEEYLQKKIDMLSRIKANHEAELEMKQERESEIDSLTLRLKSL